MLLSLSASHQRGFSLSELLVALAVAAVLGSIGVPAIRGGLAATELVHQSEHLAGVFRSARARAIGQPYPVVLCPGTELGCDASWSGGQVLLFDDVDDNEIYTASDLGRQMLPTRGAELHWVSFLRRSSISFAPGSGAVANNGSLYLCSEESSEAARIVLSRSGRVRLADCPECPVCVE